MVYLRDKTKQFPRNQEYQLWSLSRACERRTQFANFSQNHLATLMQSSSTLSPASGGFLQLELSRAQSQIHLAKSRIRSADRISEVVRAKQVNVPAWLMPMMRRDTSGLHLAAESRAKDLVDDVIRSLATQNGEARERGAAQASREFMHLLGHFPRLAVSARRELHALTKQTPALACQAERSPQPA